MRESGELMSKQVTFSGPRTNDRVTTRDLVHALECALVWLRGREPEMEVDWEVVKVQLARHIRITMSSETANGEMSARFRNLHQLQGRKMPAVAPRLTDEDIEGTKQLASIIGESFASIRISSPGEPAVKVTPILVNRVEAIARTTRSEWFEWTNLRGVVDQITTGHTINYFRLRHQITNAEIRCEFKAEMLDDVKDLLAHRAEVYGKVKYNRSDQPKLITVETIRKLPSQIPPFASVPAVDITSGMNSADYVERVRGGE